VATCAIVGCGATVKSKGMCAKHYKTVFVTKKDPRSVVPREAIEGETQFIGFKLSRELVQRVAKAMASAGIRNKSVWWRRAAEEKLERDGEK
jgi:hypothetical protein